MLTACAALAAVLFMGLAVDLLVRNRALAAHLASAEATCTQVIETGEALLHHSRELRHERDGVIRSLVSLAQSARECGLEVPQYQSILDYATRAEVSSLMVEMAATRNIG